MTAPARSERLARLLTYCHMPFSFEASVLDALNAYPDLTVEECEAHALAHVSAGEAIETVDLVTTQAQRRHRMEALAAREVAVQLKQRGKEPVRSGRLTMALFGAHRGDDAFQKSVETVLAVPGVSAGECVSHALYLEQYFNRDDGIEFGNTRVRFVNRQEARAAREAAQRLTAKTPA